ncbi:MAG: radical SAM protein [Candidatus Coatesbacteria bacterium]|nr:radical SAM protein [Candidatus Coatesbacteria bacterium]
MHLLFLQLPIPSLQFGITRENVPLASAKLASYISSRFRDIKISLMDRTLQDTLSDEGMIEAILKHDPDVIGFTSYLWNIERSLFIAGKIKSLNPQIITIFGGPEITNDNEWILNNPAVDLAVMGEGEIALEEIIGKLLCNDRDYFEAAQYKVRKGMLELNYLHDLSMISSPYLNSILERRYDDCMYLETQRGCRFNCSYCEYSHFSGKIRFFPKKEVEMHIKKAIEKGYKELFILDPTMNARSDIHEFLEVIALSNQGILELYGELIAELLDNKQVDLLAKANFKELEIGLQTINKNSLKAICRSFNKRKFLDGVFKLKEAGIRAKIDIIIGLPEDDLSSFKETCNFIYKNDIFDDIQLFILSVLPGTRLRREAGKSGISFQDKPPYYVIETDRFSRRDMEKAIHVAEDLFEMDLITLSDPVFPVSEVFSERKYISHFRADCSILKVEIPDKANHFTVFVSVKSLLSGNIISVISSHFTCNPHIPLQIFFEMDSELEINEIERKLAILPFPERGFLDRDLQAIVGDNSHLYLQYKFLVYQGSPFDTDEISNLTDIAPAYMSVRDSIKSIEYHLKKTSLKKMSGLWYEPLEKFEDSFSYMLESLYETTLSLDISLDFKDCIWQMEWNNIRETEYIYQPVFINQCHKE